MAERVGSDIMAVLILALIASTFLFSPITMANERPDRIYVDGISGGKITAAYKLNYASAYSIGYFLRPYVPSGNLISLYERNILVVTDTKERLDIIEALINEIDSKDATSATLNPYQIELLSITRNKLINHAVPESQSPDEGEMRTKKIITVKKPLSGLNFGVFKKHIYDDGKQKDSSRVILHGSNAVNLALEKLILWIDKYPLIHKSVNIKDHLEVGANYLQQVYSLPQNRTYGCENASEKDVAYIGIRGSGFLPSAQQWDQIKIGMSKDEVAATIGGRHSRSSRFWSLERFEKTCKNPDKRISFKPPGKVYWIFFDNNNKVNRKHLEDRTIKDSLKYYACYARVAGKINDTENCPPLRP